MINLENGVMLLASSVPVFERVSLFAHSSRPQGTASYRGTDEETSGWGLRMSAVNPAVCEANVCDLQSTFTVFSLNAMCKQVLKLPKTCLTKTTAFLDPYGPWIKLFVRNVVEVQLQ